MNDDGQSATVNTTSDNQKLIRKNWICEDFLKYHRDFKKQSDRENALYGGMCMDMSIKIALSLDWERVWLVQCW